MCLLIHCSKVELSECCISNYFYKLYLKLSNQQQTEDKQSQLGVTRCLYHVYMNINVSILNESKSVVFVYAYTEEDEYFLLFNQPSVTDKLKRYLHT